MASEQSGHIVGQKLVEGLCTLRDNITKGQEQWCAEVATCLEKERTRRVRAEALAKQYEAELANLRSQLASLQRRAQTQETNGKEDHVAALAPAPAVTFTVETAEDRVEALPPTVATPTVAYRGLTAEDRLEAEAPTPETATEAALRLRREWDDCCIICILGGTEFRNPKSEELVEIVALMLDAAVGDKARFVTGGMRGVQETFAKHCGDGSNVWNLLPVGESSGFEQGMDINAGADLAERKAIFGLLGDIYITVEGGPGVSQEAQAAFERGAAVIPLIRTGGASSGMFNFPQGALLKPPFATEEQWSHLANGDAQLDDSATAVADIVQKRVDEFGGAETCVQAGKSTRPVPAGLFRGLTSSLMRVSSGTTAISEEDMEKVALTPIGKNRRERAMSRTLLNKIHKEQGHWDGKPYEAVIFEGGGTKGMVYAGAIQRLDEAGLLDSVKCFAGTSAGAQTAALCAVGYRGESLREVMMTTPWKELLDSSRNCGCGCFSNFYRLFKHHGWCKGEVLEQHLERLIAKQFGPEPCTLLSLYEKKGITLRVGACNVSTRRFELLDKDTHPNMPVATAARASSNIPVVFVPVKYFSERKKQEYLYVDGGLEGNIPAKAFPGKRTLAFDLMSSGDWSKEHGSFIQPSGFTHFVGTLLDMVMNSAQSADGLAEGSKQATDLHVVKINCGDHRMLETNLSKQQVLEMVAAGWDAVDDFLGEHGAAASLKKAKSRDLPVGYIGTLDYGFQIT